MKCPLCGHIESKVLDSRPNETNESIRRRRECAACQKRFTTYETIESTPVMVIKKDGSRELFDREKILKGIIKSCEKRPVTVEQMRGIVNYVDSAVHNKLQPEISSTEIGELVMQQLKLADEIAYVRFASVYREFKDINTFIDELKMFVQSQ